MSTAKRDFLIAIEKRYQKIWEDEKIFESDAGNNAKDPGKYFGCIPYPYMNGRLHLGHCFTITKVEYASRYQRLKGKNVLFPFAYHCTGMPIKACADKLTYEMATFGCPPSFPSEDSESTPQKQETPDFEKDPTAYQKKKGKLEMKFGNTKYQWGIMEGMGIPHNEIPSFANTDHWLSYFPPHCMQDLKNMGLSADWRRGFITTDVNPYYDSFVRWHFNILKDRQKIKFGKRYSVFSPKDNQPCMDHDRKSGEGVGPQEYTGIKIKLLSPLPSALRSLGGKDVYLIAATLRPETMYGQTNCFVKDDIKYVAFEAKNNEVYITTLRAARNMAWQELTPEYGKVNIIMKLTGKDILGAAIKAPRAMFDKLYVLPMMGVKSNKGTGVVTSVPSDAPDDFATLMDLKNKQPLREKFGIEDHMVNFDPVPIIEVPGFGNLCAVTVCEELKVNSQNDKDKLLLAKEKCYRKGFDEGVMLVGNHAGKNVKVVKPIIKDEMIAAGEAFKYQEPEKEIISRSGDECVIALCDQWFLEYGEPVWKEATEKCLKDVECYFDDTRQAFERTIDWLHEHACSRSYGLGTKLPWDEQWLVESLSDSTIYMAYYTVAHLLQGDIYGSKPGTLSIKPEEMTHEVWNYIFFKDRPVPKTTISKDKLDQMRNEFQYWYPIDIRSSGKDLVQNHLTYWLYNHTAVWDKEPEKWPQSVRANGHLLMDGEKMSKSLGNIISLSEGVQLYSADGMRLALADAGDVLEDANFNTAQANAGILRLYTLIDWIRETVEDLPNLRSGPTDQFYDKVFENDINVAISQADKHYSKTMFREAMIVGFYEFLLARDRYRELSAAGKGMHKDLIRRYIKAQMILLAPVCPHATDYVWRELLKESGSVINASWPECSTPDDSLTKAASHLMECVHDFRLRLINYTNPNVKKKGKAVKPNEPPNHMTIFVAKDYPKWQEVTLNHLKANFSPSSQPPFPDNQQILQHLKVMPEVKPMLKKVMPFVAFVKSQVAEKGPSVLESHLSFNESNVFEKNKDYILRSLDLDSLEICEASTYHDQKLVADVCPGKPMCKFEKRELDPVDKEHAQVTLVNIQPCTPFFKQSIKIYDTDTIDDIIARLKRTDRKLKAKQVEVYRYVDPVKGPRQLLAFDQPMMWNKRKLEKCEKIEYCPASGLKSGKNLIGDTLCYVVS